MGGEQNHTTALAPRGGSNGHMHAVLDHLSPSDAAVEVEHEFTGWHVHMTGWATVWADTTMGPAGESSRITLRAPNAYELWRLIAAEEWHWFIAATALAHMVGAA